MKRIVIVGLACALVLVSCSSDDRSEQQPSGDVLIGIRASTDPAVGDERLLFAVNEINGTRRGSPDEMVSIVTHSLEAPDNKIEADAIFTWIVPGSIGLYRAQVPFDRAGLWEIDFAISTGEATEPFLIDIQAEPQTVAIGELAPRVKTQTLADRPIEELTTDGDPLPALYESSLDELLENGQKTVALFATPGYCVSATCGPLVNQAKEILDTTPGVNFIHIEVYEGFTESGFAPDVDHLVPAVVAFGLPSEPWIFVMDEDGVVIARFEGVLGEGELEAILNGDGA
jgi:hypothetical protein